MTVEEFQGLVASGGFPAAERALNAAGGFSTPTAVPTPTPTPTPTPIPTANVEPASVSAFTQLERSGRKGTDLMERGNRRISMRDGSTTDTVADFFNDELNDEQKAFVNGWDGGIWTFASSAQDMTELKRNLNFHFKNAPETVGKEILQVDQSSTPVTDEGKRRMAFLNPPVSTPTPVPTPLPTPVPTPLPTPVPTVSTDQAYLDAFKDGTITNAAHLDKIEDESIREDAANFLAQGIFKRLGNTQAAVSELSNIYNRYIDYQGAEAIGFGAWATNTGMDWAKVPDPGAGDTITSTTVNDSPDDYFPEFFTNQSVIDALENSVAQSGNETDVTFTVADIDSALSSGAITTAEAITKFRELNTAEGNSRATALETGTGIDTGVPRAQVVPSDAPDLSEITGGGPLSRAALFANQQDADLRRRLMADAFGTNQSPLAKRASSDIFNRFARIDPLLEFSNPAQTLGQRFTDFAGAPNQTSAALNTSLDRLMGTATNPNSNFLDFVPDFRTAAQLGMSPGFADINPRLARRGQSRLMDDFDIRMSQKPELFQTPDAENLAAQIAEFRSRGF